MAVLRALLALLCIVSFADSQSFKAQSSQRAALTSCSLPGVDSKARCGTFEVYEDRRSQKGRKIALKIAVLPAWVSKPAPDALFILAGGPGQAATENADFFALTFAKVREERDIVLVDQRGTGGSNGLHCDLYGESLQGHLGDLLPIEAIKVCRADGYSTNLSPCVDQLMADFIARGSVKGLDTSCVDRVPQTPFQIPSTQSGKDKPMTSDDEQELRKLENDWLSVYISGDKATYDRVVADDFTGTDESAVKRSKEQDRALLPAAPVPGGVALNEDMQVRFYGETAVVTGRIVTKVKVGDQEVPGFTTRFTDTWLKRQGRWQVIARHYSRVPMERKAIKLDTKIYEAYVGEYEIAPGIAIGVFKEGESLFGQATGQPKFELHPESEIVFFLKEPPALFLFIRNDKGRLAQMLTIQDGRVTSAKKIK
jgi:ketosteroid isomerase-like protein